jgi:cytochrome c peroxidase
MCKCITKLALLSTVSFTAGCNSDDATGGAARTGGGASGTAGIGGTTCVKDMNRLRLLLRFTFVAGLMLPVVIGCGANDENDGANPAPAGQHLFQEETFGGNGRTCRTCHTSENGTITVEQVQALFAVDPSAPLFRSIDSDDGIGDSFARLTENATIRVVLPIPANIRLRDEPDATVFTVNRGIPTTMDISLTDQVVMSDGRDADLAAQALAAVDAHYEPTSRASPAQGEAIAAFQATNGFFSSDETFRFARGGAAPELPLGETEAQHRGRRFFEPGGQCNACHDGPMLNRTGAQNPFFPVGSRFEGNFVSANAEPIGVVGGNFLTTANVERDWVIDTARDGFGGDDDLELTIPDLGRALITGDAADIAHFKIPTLRNIRNTPPYFRDGSAKTLEDVVNHYQQFINAVGNVCDENTGACDMTDQDKSDVVAFLHLL